MKSFQLVPSDSRKSFYNKCRVEIDQNETRNLISYDTNVATISVGGILKITKNENHLTQTTLRHITAFLEYYQIAKMTKSQILDM